MTSFNKSLATIVLIIAACLTSSKDSKATEFRNGCTIPYFELYQYGGGGGKKLRACSTEYSSLRDDPHVIGDVNWNDKASSIRTNGRLVSLYSDSRFQGSCIVVKTPPSTDGNFHSSPALNLSDVGFNDTVSSIRVGKDSRCTDLTVASSSRLGFYKQQDRPEVYLVYRAGFYCHVQNPNQMDAFGGFGKVQVVNSLNLNATKTGGCGWPNGFFKLSNKPEVYRMYGGGIPEFNIGDSFCHVANPAQMNAYGGFGQVRAVSPSSDLGRGRQFTGKCSNP